MTYQRSTLADKVKRRLKDGAFSDSDINDYLNDIQNEVVGADEYPFLEAIDTDTLSVGDKEYTLPTDYQVSILFEVSDPANINNTLDLTYVPYRQLLAKQPNALIATAQYAPCKYTLFANRLIFDVPVDKAYTVKLYYLKKPTQMTADTDVPVIPEEFSEIYVLGALERAEESRDNYDFAAIHSNKKTELIENLRLRYGVRQIGVPGQIVRTNLNATV